MVAGAAEFAEMRSAVDVWRQLIGDELRNLRIVVPGRRDAEWFAELRLIGGLQLGIVKYVRPVVERPLVAVVEHAPALALVQGDRLVERVVVVEVRLVHVFRDIVVDRKDHAAVGERRYPCRLDVEHVVGAGIGDVLGDRLGILIGMGQFDDVEIDAGQRLPKRPREILRLERLQTRFVGEIEGDALVLVALRRLHRTVGRTVRRAFGRRLHGRRLGLAERRALVCEFDLGNVDRCGPGLGARGRVAQSGEHGGAAHQHELGQKFAAGGIPPKPRIDFFRKSGVEVSSFAIVHHLASSLDASPAVSLAGRANRPNHIVVPQLVSADSCDPTISAPVHRSRSMEQGRPAYRVVFDLFPDFLEVSQTVERVDPSATLSWSSEVLICGDEFARVMGLSAGSSRDSPSASGGQKRVSQVLCSPSARIRFDCCAATARSAVDRE